MIIKVITKRRLNHMRFPKKLLTVALVIVFALAAVPFSVLAADVTVTVDGQVVTFADQEPVLVGGRTLVPVRDVFEALGFTPSWDGATRTATLVRESQTIVITIDSYIFTTNGVQYTLDVPAQLMNGRTMLPLRAILESVGYEVDESATGIVAIMSPALDESTDPQPPPSLADEDEPEDEGEEPEDEVDEPEDIASFLIGTWVRYTSDLRDTRIFNADGTVIEITEDISEDLDAEYFVGRWYNTWNVEDDILVLIRGNTTSDFDVRIIDSDTKAIRFRRWDTNPYATWYRYVD